MTGKDNNNGFPLSDDKMDHLFKQAVRLELERKKAMGLPISNASNRPAPPDERKNYA